MLSLVVGALVPAAAQTVGELTYTHWWGGTTMQALEETLLKDFRERTGVRVSQQYISYGGYYDRWVALTAAGLPMGDAVLVDAKFAQDMYAAGDYFIDLRPLLERDGIPVDAFSQPALAQFIPGLHLDGPIYALPVVVGTIVPFFNRNALDSAGVAPNDGSWTWDTFFDIARKVRYMEAGEVLRFGVGGSVMGTFNALVASYGGSFLSEDRSQPVMNNEIVLNALETLVELTAENVFGGVFTSGSNVFHIGGDWDPGWWAELPFSWDIMEMPKGPKGGFTMAWSNGIAIPKGLPEERVELAWELIKLYVMNPERKGLPDIYLYMMPAYIPLAVSEEYLFAQPAMNRRLIVELHMNNLIQVELTPNFAEWHDRLLSELVSQAINGQIPPSNALVQAEELIRERGLLTPQR